MILIVELYMNSLWRTRNSYRVWRAVSRVLTVQSGGILLNYFNSKQVRQTCTIKKKKKEHKWYSTAPTSFQTGKKIFNAYSPKGKIIHFKCSGKKSSSEVQVASTGIRQRFSNPDLLVHFRKTERNTDEIVMNKYTSHHNRLSIKK